ncbi:response regulator [Paucibacter sp. APW11]|uniref:Response regulator n=1 Tax=Roseateles aquae TaxID=3077235 RepID=A0ABU3PBV5_9BURK|nr:response regulator [Paucibacter sp. APW11]MDT9000044.1 response regulator [Paucibacter sp. APW11]
MKKILIVDDHADIRRLIRMTLEFEDYEIQETADGQAALVAARDWQPDLVLMDVMMPGPVDGLEACRQLKQGQAGKVPPVILLTARGTKRDRDAGLEAGADAYLVKPFGPLQLIESIASIWQKAA